MKHRRRGVGLAPVAALAACAIAVAAAAAVEVAAQPGAVEPAADVAASLPSSGWWYCPVTAGEDEEALLAVTPATSEATTVTVVRYTGDGRVPDDPVELDPGEEHLRTLAPGEAADPVAVRWTGGPAVVTWRVEGPAGEDGADDPDVAAASCESAPAPRWHVTGFDTTAQNRGLLHLFNPFAVDAVVRVTFGTPSGEVALVLTDNVLVPAGDTLAMVLNDYEPEQPDLAVTVETLAGRVVASGETRLQPTANQPGPTGRAVLGASPEPAETWSLGSAASGDGASSWLSVYNPGDREAAVEVRVSDPLPDGAALLSEASVPAGGVVRIELDETSATPEYGVAVQTVTELPVVVAGVGVVRTEEGDGVAASLAAQPSEQWALAGAGVVGWSARLALYNPGAEAVSVTVDAGGDTPAPWERVEIEPNGRVALDLAEAGAERASVPLRARAGGPFVAELRSRSAEPPVRLWNAVSVPARVWEGPATRPATWRDPALSTSPVVPVATSEPEEAGDGPDSLDGAPETDEPAP